MPLREPYPELEELLTAIGKAGRRVSGIDAGEGAAGNISLCIGWPLEVRRRFPVIEQIPLPQMAPALAGKLLIVSGSGRRLRDIHKDPAANLGAAVIHDDGQTARLHTAPRCLFEHAADRIEYVETAAMYEYMDVVNHSQAEGLTQDELRTVVEAFDVKTSLV